MPSLASEEASAGTVGTEWCPRVAESLPAPAATSRRQRSAWLQHSSGSLGAAPCSCLFLRFAQDSERQQHPPFLSEMGWRVKDPSPMYER